MKKINNLPEYIISVADTSNVCEVQKFSCVKARTGIPGEIIKTVLKNGLEETLNRVRTDPETGHPDWVVTNPSGEEYIVGDKVFRLKYEPTDEGSDQYRAKGQPVISVMISEDIEFTAPWGEVQSVLRGGRLIVASADDIYGIDKDSFAETYRKTDNSTAETYNALQDMLKLRNGIQH